MRSYGFPRPRKKDMSSVPWAVVSRGRTLRARHAVAECRRGGAISPTLTAGEPEIYVFEGVYEI